MWEKILGTKLGLYMVKVSGETEDDETVYDFFEYIKNRIKDYRVVLKLASKWKSYDENRQVSEAIGHAGMFHTSRFIMLMEFLADEIEKGEYKIEEN